MRIGIIVYSQTGHTLQVAQELLQCLSAAGHDLTLEQVETAGPVRPGAKAAELKTAPAVDSYDALVLASPAHGGLPAAGMMSYLDQLPSLEGKRVGLLATGAFPAKWGSVQTMAKMAETVAARGATVCGSASVGWWSLNRKRQIAKAVDSLSGHFR